MKPIAAALSVLLLASGGARAEPFAAHALGFHPTSNTLLMVRGREGGVRIVDFADPAKPLERELSAVAQAADFIGDGARIVLGEKGLLRVVSLDGKSAGPDVEAAPEPIIAVAVSPRGGALALLDRKIGLQLWDFGNGPVRRRWQATLERVSDYCVAGDVAFAPDESAVAAISCFNNIYVRSRAGRAIAVPRGREGYESCCGVKIRFSLDGQFLVGRRGAQPGWSAHLWTYRGGVLSGGRVFPGTDYARDIAFLKGTREVLVLDKDGLRRIDPLAPRRATTLLAISPQETDAIAVSADGARLAMIEGGDAITFRALGGALLGSIKLR
jgi:hypothetical protein